MGLKNVLSAPRLLYDTRVFSAQKAKRLQSVVNSATRVVPQPEQRCRSAGCFCPITYSLPSALCPPLEGPDAGFSTSPRPPPGYPGAERATPLAPPTGEEVDGLALSPSAEDLNSQ